MGKQAICKAISKLSKKFLAPKLLQAPAAAGSVRAGSTHRPLLLAAHGWEMLGSCIQHVGLLGATYPMLCAARDGGLFLCTKGGALLRLLIRKGSGGEQLPCCCAQDYIWESSSLACPGLGSSVSRGPSAMAERRETTLGVCEQLSCIWVGSLRVPARCSLTAPASSCSPFRGAELLGRRVSGSCAYFQCWSPAGGCSHRYL